MPKDRLLRLIASALSDDAASDDVASDNAASDGANSDDVASDDPATEDSCQTLGELIDNGEESGGEEPSGVYVGDAVAVADVNAGYSCVQNGVPNFKLFFLIIIFSPVHHPPPPTTTHHAAPLSTSMRQLIWFNFESGKDDKHILDVTEISVRQLRKMRRNWEEFGEVVRPHMASGRPKKLNRIHQEALLEYLEQRPTAFQDKMSWFLWDEFHSAGGS